MATNRQYEPAQVFNCRIVDMRHLWTPSHEYQGKQTQKPNYFAGFLVPKTQAHWSTEPIFGGVMQAFGKLLSKQLQAYAGNPLMVGWPIIDGDMPNPTTQKVSEHAKGHWLYNASTNSVPNVELCQAGGSLVKLLNKVNVKSGDYVMTGLTAAVKSNMPNAVKFYLNAVLFCSPGEEIVFANSVSGAELMKYAEAQGLRPAGFSASPGGFSPQSGGQQFGGFTPQNGGGFTPGWKPNGGGFTPGAQPQGFQPGPQPQQQNGFQPQGAPQGGGFTPQGQPGGFAPTQGNPAPGHAAGQNWNTGPGNGSVSHFNPAAGAPPNPFQPQQNGGFVQR